MQRQVHVSVVPGRGSLSHHHPRANRAKIGELPESPRHVIDAMADGKEKALRGTEEPAAVRDTWFGEHVIEIEAQCAAEHEVLPVVMVLPSAVMNSSGMAGPSPNPIWSVLRTMATASSCEHTRVMEAVGAGQSFDRHGTHTPSSALIEP